MQFLEKDFTLRDKESHKKQCSEVETDTTNSKSKLYGINRDSILNELKYFHVCSGALLPDIMHDILEGALQYEVKLMLKDMIYSDGYFPLEFLNTRIDHLELGFMETKDRPTPISDTTIHSEGGNLKQAGILVVHTIADAPMCMEIPQGIKATPPPLQVARPHPTS